ncbi:MAG: hypothetical protein EBR82_81765 [Caulobacteraceae bacterium]|nr:hypothetical protein [Caulobacteraceae bacterium]
MKNTKHTPGPWKLDDVSDFIRGPRGVYIAELCDANSDRVQVHGPRFEANARLMAAAPDLLEACEAAFNCLDLLGEEYSGTAGILAQAIRKAKGDL